MRLSVTCLGCADPRPKRKEQRDVSVNRWQVRLLEPARDYAQTVTKLRWTRIERLANLWLSQQTDLKPNSRRRADVVHISI